MLDKTRRAIQKHLPRGVADKLKGLRWVLLKNQSDLDDAGKQKLQVVYELSPILRRLHQLKERFRSIFNHITDRKQAERFLRAWFCEVKQFVKQFGCNKLLKFVNTLENWWNPILNYFNERITNGAVEGINNRIKLIKRRAYGYRNVTNFRNRIVAEINAPGPLAVCYHTNAR